MNQILLIRHAEKPTEPPLPITAGIETSGTPDDESLTVRGWQRAGALAVLFGPDGRLGQPKRIYASAAEKFKTPGGKVGSKSQRPLETVTPLAGKLGLTPIDTFTKSQEAVLAAELKTLGGTTLVCWQHEAIPANAVALLGKAESVPQRWPDDRFDVIWRFVDNGSGKLTFDQIFQDLLKGDSSTPIPVLASAP
jgi:hypothetical protein